MYYKGQKVRRTNRTKDWCKEILEKFPPRSLCTVSETDNTKYNTKYNTLDYDLKITNNKGSTCLINFADIEPMTIEPQYWYIEDAYKPERINVSVLVEIDKVTYWVPAVYSQGIGFTIENVLKDQVNKMIAWCYRPSSVIPPDEPLIQTKKDLVEKICEIHLKNMDFEFELVKVLLKYKKAGGRL